MDIYRNYLMFTHNATIAWWLQDCAAHEIASSEFLTDAAKSAKFCNLEYYLKTKGWI